MEILNRKARYDYEIEDTYEAGIVLTGTEIKSIRQGKANIKDSYAIVRNNELYLLNTHISLYNEGNRFNHEETRTRKLLMHKKEILKLRDKLESLGAIVYLTRDSDYDLSKPNASLRKRSDLSNRAKMINSSDADIYLSIHLNFSSNTSWKGAQVFYDDINKNNEKLANIFQKNFNKYLNSNRKIQEISTLYMYKRITKI